jgi:ferrochelatase
MLKSRFAPEPHYTHGQTPKTGVLLCNLGTPDAPTATALRSYLAEFLGDPRVVEIPRLLWLVILHGIILRVRPAKSAHKYATIWTEQGSPLKVWTDRQVQALQERFDAAGQSLMVRTAMTYGQPAITSVLDEMRAAGVTRILVLPAYPQYSGTTTAAVFDRIHLWSLRTRTLPEWRFVNHYHDDPGYIRALAESVREHWSVHGQPEQLVMSFHGVPERTLMQGDPYHCECHKTARLLAETLGLDKTRYRVTFQSRFGKAKWLEPYTEPTVRALAQSGVQRVDVICPGFTSDCLETLEEIAMEVKTAFLEEGGKVFHYIPCLNDRSNWIDALCDIAWRHMQGWPLQAPPEENLHASRRAALDLGATH